MNAPCPFCPPDSTRIFYAGERIIGLWDGYPVSPGHALLVPRRHVESWLEMSAEERRALTDGIAVAYREIQRQYAPAGFNFGMNIGTVAGQTVPHLHLHVIPRYAGDVAEPRGGVRNVIPGRGLYGVASRDLPVVLDQPAVYESANPPVSAATEISHADSTSFGERMLQLLDEGQRSSTYKFAVLLALIDLCLELGLPPAGEVPIPTRRLAERVLDLYWPQTAQYKGERVHVILVQNASGQAEIISDIRAFRERAGADPSEPLHRAQLRDPNGFQKLITTVEWKLIEMPLPKLQRLNKTVIDFLYRIGWDDHVTRRVAYSDAFDRHIYLRPGVCEHLLRLSGLLRPLVQQAWAGMVVKMNRDATDEARLMEFLFGARRITLSPVQPALRELQDNRCFYCDGRITGAADVDHFIPWARHPDNGIENLVVADTRCNNSKRDLLAAGDHVARWAARFEPVTTSTALSEIALRAGWETHSARTFDTARSIYSRLPDDVRLWCDRTSSVAVANQRAALNRSLRLP